jgi:hypothetical protein
MPRTTGVLMLAVFVLLPHGTADAQHRRVGVGIDLGAATTWDDEGLLGRGAAVGGHVSVDLNDHLTVSGVLDRVPYRRDTSWLRFDGQFDFMGAELEHRFGGTAVQPFVVGGIGVVHFSDTWVQKLGGPLQLSATQAINERHSTYGGAVAGAGLDISLSSRVSLRPALRVYMMNPRSDLHPTMSVRPGVGLTMRW